MAPWRFSHIRTGQAGALIIASQRGVETWWKSPSTSETHGLPSEALGLHHLLLPCQEASDGCGGLWR